MHDAATECRVFFPDQLSTELVHLIVEQGWKVNDPAFLSRVVVLSRAVPTPEPVPLDVSEEDA
jgi:hypothetical protein